MEIGNPTVITAVAGVLTGIVGVVTFLKSVLEYIKQGSSKRAEQFLEMRTRLRGNPEFVEICELLDADDSLQLCDMPILRKDNFIAFFEDLYLLWNSNVFNDEIVYYMFGYFALSCWRNDDFWKELDREEPTYGHFKAFVTRLAEIQKNYKPNSRKFRL